MFTPLTRSLMGNHVFDSLMKKLVTTGVQILIKPWETYNLISHESNASFQMLIHQFLELI